MTRPEDRPPVDPTDPRVPDEQRPLLHSARRRSPLAGWSDASAHWTVPGAIGLFAVALLVTAAYVPSWQMWGSGLLMAPAAVLAHLGLRRGRAYALPTALAAVVLVVLALVLLVNAPV